MAITRRRFLQLSAAASAAPGLARAAAEPSPEGAEAPRPAAAPGWRRRELARKPNIVIAVLDDVGFADLGCYGAEHRTPCIDGLADAGTRFNNFHVTALCSPTRACLLTGRNAHAVGVGNIAEWGRKDHPGYRGWIRQDAATLAEILKPAGYSTIAAGKWHLSPLADQNGSGPFEHWPVGRGFDHWYGFHGSAVDHWHPEMFENTSAAYPDKDGNYHLSADLVDRSIHYVGDHLAASPGEPFFLYLAFGACHFPLHAPADDVRRHRGAYDRGWEAVRAERYARQQEIGIVPGHARLAPLNPDVPPWSALTKDQRRFAARGQEVYAAFLEHTDAQLARLLSFLERENQYDDTVVLVISDNGAAAGGPIEGRLDVRRAAYLGEEPLEELLANIDLMGSDASYCSYSRGWAQASNTPLKWYKADTYGGGIRAPLIVSWPNGGLPGNAIRDQYHHAIDVVPTLLEMIDAPLPAAPDGGAPLPLQGTSFAYAFDRPDAPTPKTVQYFETLGDRAIWADGWKAVARHRRGTPFEEDDWELYHTASDFSEVHDLAAAEPQRLERLIALWRREAERYDILPLDDDTLRLYRASVPEPRATYVFYPGMTRLDRLSAPDIYSFDSRFSAEVTLSGMRANGVILAAGDSGAGYELYMRDGFLVFTYVYTRETQWRLKSDRRMPRGKHVLGLDLAKTGESAARATLLLDGAPVGALELPKLWPIYTANSGVRCGENRHAPVSRAYEAPFVFDQRLSRVVVDVEVPSA